MIHLLQVFMSILGRFNPLTHSYYLICFNAAQACDEAEVGVQQMQGMLRVL